MDLFSHPDYIKNLQNLLRPPNENDDSDSDSDVGFDRTPSQGIRSLGPGGIGPTKSTSKTSKIQAPIKPEVKKSLPIDDDKDQMEKWLDEQEKEDKEVLETRKRPEYNITYKQAVGTEDLFLGMGNKTSGSMSCEDMMIEIQMPEETVAVEEMELSVTQSEIDLQSPMYRLKIPLPQPIDPDKGSAKYDKDNKILLLTLRMKREFDFVNF